MRRKNRVLFCSARRVFSALHYDKKSRSDTACRSRFPADSTSSDRAFSRRLLIIPDMKLSSGRRQSGMPPHVRSSRNKLLHSWDLPPSPLCNPTPPIEHPSSFETPLQHTKSSPKQMSPYPKPSLSSPFPLLDVLQDSCPFLCLLKKESHRPPQV